MLLGRTVVGLDIGSYAVRAAELRAGLREMELVRVEELFLPQGASPEEREATIQLFLEQRNLRREFMITALPADRVTQRHLRFPFSGGKRIDQAIAFEIAEDLPFSLASTVIAHEQVMSSPDQTDVLAVLAPRLELQSYLESMARMEIDPRIIETEGAVLGNLSSVWPLSELGRIVLDIGHRQTVLCLLVDGMPVMQRGIPVAGQHLTEAIARDFKLSIEAAEEQKHSQGIFEQGGTKPISAGVRSALDRLTREILRSLQSVVGDPLATIAPAEIVLVGGSAQIPGLASYFEERTSLSCQVLGAAPPDAGLSGLPADRAPAFAQAVALALRGAPTGRVTQTDYRKDEQFHYTPDLSGLESQLRIAAGLFAAVLLLWIASTVSGYFSARASMEAHQTQLESVYSQTFPGDPLPSDPAARIREKLRETRALADHLGVTGTGLSVLEVLRFISDRIPAKVDISLRELTVRAKGIDARGHSPDFESVDRVREELGKVPHFREVVLSDVVNDRKRGGKSFNLTIKLSENGS
jgi:type IV pilus assembly protein PilM